MASKAQFQPSGFPFPQIQTASKRREVPQSERKSRETIHANHEVLRSMDAAQFFELVPDAMVLVDRDGRIALANRKTEKMFGYGREELVGEPVEMLMPERFRDGYTELRSRCSEASLARHMGEWRELYGRHRDGHELAVQISSTPLEIEDGVLVSSVIRDVSDSKCSQELAIAEQLKFETALGELLTTFINLSPSQLDAQIIEAQKRICETLGLDRCALGQATGEGDDLIITHSWAAEGFNTSRRLSKREFPWVMQMLLDGRPVKFARIDDLPEEAAKDKETFGQNGLKSLVAFPLSAAGKKLGAVAFISCRAEREWPAPLVQQLAVAAQVFANAFSRAQADKALSHAYNEIKRAQTTDEKENIYLREEVKLEHHHDEVIGDGIRRILKQVEQVAPTDSTVLLLGETGTGKELIARTIHAHSRRSARVMVKVNCAALPASLVESELFGREKGAFTGALTREMGRFELANGSTILLDEIGELPIELQTNC